MVLRFQVSLPVVFTADIKGNVVTGVFGKVE